MVGRDDVRWDFGFDEVTASDGYVSGEIISEIIRWLGTLKIIVEGLRLIQKVCRGFQINVGHLAL